MRTVLLSLGLFTLATAASGCAARSDGIYQDEVTKVIQANAGTLSQCHAAALTADPAAAGSVAVSFRVEADTGEFTNAVVDPAKTTAPESLQQCAVNGLQGLKLEPGDNRPANATYEIVFPSVGGEVAAAPAAAAQPAGPSLKAAPDPTAQ